jgi:hypothetical protein
MQTRLRAVVDGVVGMEPRRDSMKGRAMREPALRRNRRRVEFITGAIESMPFNVRALAARKFFRPLIATF